MNVERDVYIPPKYRSSDALVVAKVWQTIPPEGIYLTALKMKVCKRSQEILPELIAAWEDRNFIKTRNPTNFFIIKRPKGDWEHVTCPRCRKSFNSRAYFQEHWAEESRGFSRAELNRYNTLIRD